MFILVPAKNNGKERDERRKEERKVDVCGCSSVL